MAVAAIDIGTNSVRLLIVDDAGRELEREMQITRLGQGVDVSGALSAEAIARTVAVLERYALALARHRVERVRATATSAARDAENSAAFFDAAERALGTRPELLSGEEEARLSFLGATAGLDPESGPFLVIDIGGGSTEFVLGRGQPEVALSLDMGCVRMTERHLVSDPPSEAELSACEADVREKLAALPDRLRGPLASPDGARARRVIGLAGTVTAIAALELGLDHYDASRTHHMRLTREAVERQCARLFAATVEERRAMLAEPKRAEVIVGGAVVLATLLRVLAIDALLVSETDILDGLAMSLATLTPVLVDP